MADVRFAAFDTNVLLGSGWPQPSAQLTSILGFMYAIGVVPLLPEAVKLELEGHWCGDLDQKFNKTSAAVAEIQRHARGLGPIKCEVQLPTADDLKGAYQRRVDELIAEWKVVEVPLTSRGVRDFLVGSISKVPPFQKEGKGFQDSIILYSLIDFLRREQQPAAFVSKDSDFEHTAVDQICAAEGVSISFVRDLQALETVLRAQAAARIAAVWNAEREKLRVALADRRADIEQYINERLEFTPDELGFGLGALVAVHRIEIVGDPESISVPYPETVPESGEVAFSFEIKVQILAEVRPSPTVPRPTMKVGEAVLDPLVRFWVSSRSSESTVQQTLDQTVLVQGKATPTKAYTDALLTDVQLKSTLANFTNLLWKSAWK